MADNLSMGERVAKLEGIVEVRLRYYRHLFSHSIGVELDKKDSKSEDTVIENLTLEERIAKLEEEVDEISSLFIQSCLKDNRR